MKPPLRIKDVERITLRVPFTPRVQRWNALLVWQWQIVEIIRVTTDDGTVGYGETLPHYTWGVVPEDGPQRVMGRNPVELLGDDSLGAGLQMALYDVVGKALGVPVHRLFNMLFTHACHDFGIICYILGSKLFGPNVIIGFA